jgi:hypothetical protein
MTRTCKTFQLTGVLITSLGLFITSCKKQEIAVPTTPVAQPVKEDPVVLNAINSTWTVNWNNYATGPYTSTDAAADFGNVTGWNDSRTYISEGIFRIKLLKDALSADGGLIAKIDVSDGAAYELDFDVKFHSQFDFSRGGKIGFGFLVGDGNSGGDPGWDGNGGSLRLTWYQNDAGRVYFQPYLYYKDQPGEYGDTFDKTYPTTGSLVRGHWYHVHQYIKSNTGSNTDGHVQITVDGTVLLDRDIRWTTNDTKRLVRRICLSTFRGGSQDYWMSPTDGYIYFDNLSVHKISN